MIWRWQMVVLPKHVFHTVIGFEITKTKWLKDVERCWKPIKNGMFAIYISTESQRKSWDHGMFTVSYLVDFFNIHRSWTALVAVTNRARFCRRWDTATWESTPGCGPFVAWRQVARWHGHMRGLNTVHWVLSGLMIATKRLDEWFQTVQGRCTIWWIDVS